MKSTAALLLAAALCGCSASEKQGPRPVAWQAWGDTAFAKAKAENKLVLLDLGAVWCHWCHVMDKETYENPQVERELAEHWVAVHVNQDERPDLANRYEDYGWPATILFDASGRELGKYRGFMPPKRLLSMLEAFDADPTPGPSAMAGAAPVAAENPSLPKDLDDALHAAWESAYDREHAGWGTVLKYLDPDCVELAMVEGRDEMARPTLDAMLQLIDPVWGGVYQYSHGGVWSNPHFEKIMSFQAEDMRIYALAYRIYGDEKYLKAAKDIERYLVNFLRSPEGAFYASQDADLVQGEHGGEYFKLDDAGRRAKGIPRIDRNLYARENGWAGAGLAGLFCAEQRKATLDAALTVAELVARSVEGRGLSDPCFSHQVGKEAIEGIFLVDQVAMARAFLELSEITQDAAWLKRATSTMSAIDRQFRSDNGFLTASMVGPIATRQVDENISVARAALRLFHLSGESRWKSMAEHAMKFLAGVAKDANGVRAAGILLAAREFAADPVKIVIVGETGEERTERLLRAARSAPAAYLVIRLFAPGASSEFALEEESPTAYVCSDGACSSPLHDPEALRKSATPARRR